MAKKNITVNVILGPTWKNPKNFISQTPGGEGVWGKFKFYQNADFHTDYAIVVNHSFIPFIDADHVWTIIMEPPIGDLIDFQKGHPQSERVLTYWDKQIDGNKYIKSHQCTPWLINKTWDEIRYMPMPIKTKIISCANSGKTSFHLHRKRNGFIDIISNSIGIDLYGKNINYIEDKLDGLLPYRYSIAIENWSGSDHFTEKVSDCFMSYTMPIYYGCTNLADYYPEGSFIQIDINNPEEASQTIKNAINSGAWEKNFESIKEARNKFFNELHFFPHIARLIEQYG